MIKGMTGFGHAQFSTGSMKALVEIKSLNHRYFDINFYLPVGFGSIENKIRQLVQKNIERGRVTVSVKITDKPGQTVVLNKSAVKKYISFSRTLKKELRLDGPLTMADLIALPGVVETKEIIIDADRSWPSLQKSIKKSLNGLLTMRQREGRSLAADVSEKLKGMSAQVKKIKSRSKLILNEKKKKLSDEEFSAFQKNADVNEEISRTVHYIDEIKSLLRGKVAVGKRIDFIAQEMQRETNTIGSKLQDKVVSNAVIALKSKVEKIREQSQNIE